MWCLRTEIESIEGKESLRCPQGVSRSLAICLPEQKKRGCSFSAHGAPVMALCCTTTKRHLWQGDTDGASYFTPYWVLCQNRICPQEQVMH